MTRYLDFVIRGKRDGAHLCHEKPLKIARDDVGLRLRNLKLVVRPFHLWGAHQVSSARERNHLLL